MEYGSTVCRYCGGEFEKRCTEQVYCSPRCKWAWWEARKRLRSRPGWSECPACGDWFLPKRRRKFCSGDCCRAYQSHRRHLHVRECVTCGQLSLRRFRSPFCSELCRKGGLTFKRSNLYFVQAEDGGPVKIGRTTFPEQRLAALQTAHPVRLVLRAVVPDGGKLERKLHERFAAHRMLGEWFEPTLELEAEIERFEERAA